MTSVEAFHTTGLKTELYEACDKFPDEWKDVTKDAIEAFRARFPNQAEAWKLKYIDPNSPELLITQ